VLDTLHEPRFVDLAPAEVYATLLDEGRYLCSERTMYRLLAAHHEVRGTAEPAPASPPRGPPSSYVHYGLAEQRVAARASVLATAYAAPPERFPGGLPQPRACPQEVWINRPRTPVTEEASSAIACEAAVPRRIGDPVESAILDPRGTTG
jgi:hypothetical protein